MNFFFSQAEWKSLKRTPSHKNVFHYNWRRKSKRLRDLEMTLQRCGSSWQSCRNMSTWAERISEVSVRIFTLTIFLNTFHKTHKIWMINTEWLDSHQLISNCSSGNIPNVKLKLCLYLGCILMNHSRGLKKSQHKLDAVLLHLKLTS